MLGWFHRILEGAPLAFFSALLLLKDQLPSAAPAGSHFALAVKPRPLHSDWLSLRNNTGEVCSCLRGFLQAFYIFYIDFGSFSRPLKLLVLKEIQIGGLVLSAGVFSS